MPRRLTLVFPVASALLTILAFPNWNQSFLAWVALMPLAIIAQHSASRRDAFLHGWLAGTLAYTGLLSWLIDTFQAAHQPMALAILCLVALSAYLGLYWGVWALSLSYSGARPGLTERYKWESRPGLVVWRGAAVWVGLEYLRTHLFSGFPWALLADSQVYQPLLIQIASVTGTYGVSFVVVLVNLALASGRFRTLFPVGTMVLAAYGYGFYVLHQPAPAASHPFRVALLQGNIDQYKKWDARYVHAIQNTYASLVAQAIAKKPDLIIWPETSVPGYLLQQPELRRWLENVVRDSRTWHIVGTPVQHNEMSYNSSFSINPEGHLEGEYAKVHLVPFGEIVPWSNMLGRWIPVLNELGGFAAGTWPAVLPAGPVKVGVNICYEAIFPDLVRRSVKAGAEVIVNITNDGWYMKTAAPYQHMAPNILRAVENRRWLLRADNTGVSAIIDPWGRLIAASGIFEPAVVEGIVYPHAEQTPYTRWGDWFAWLCLVSCVFWGGRAILRARRGIQP